MTNSHRISRIRNILVGASVCVTLTLLAGYVIRGLEDETPGMALVSPAVIGSKYTLKGVASDHKSGIERIWISIIQQGKEVVVLDQRFPSSLFFTAERLKQYDLSVDVYPRSMGLTDGDAMLRISLWDLSLRAWGKGNQYYEERPVRIDTTAPIIEIGTENHYLNQGGSGVAVFKVSEEVATAGMQVGNRLFPASPNLFDNPKVFIVYFAIPFDKGPETRLEITATDPAGNKGRASFPYLINRKTFRKDTIHLSDGFLRKTVEKFPEWKVEGATKASAIDTFLSLNRTLRKKNFDTILDACSKSDPKKHWAGVFLRMAGAARKSGFADTRTFMYNNQPVDTQVHMGIDLASTPHAPVSASNHGRVAFVGDIGIYGKTIIIDHGLFLFSIYSHLNATWVAENDMVLKGDKIGVTGTTGIAGGDHLHFGILVAHTFVNPIEWWDPNWIKNRITDGIYRAENKLDRTKKEAVR